MKTGKAAFAAVGFTLFANLALLSSARLADAADSPTVNGASGFQLGVAQRSREPLTPSVQITRRGRTLRLDYKVTNADGQPYAADVAERTPPHFIVYSGQQEIGSGDFAYG